MDPMEEKRTNEHIRFHDEEEEEEDVPMTGESGNPAPRKRTRDTRVGNEADDTNTTYTSAQVAEMMKMMGIRPSDKIPSAKFNIKFGGTRKDNVEQWFMDVEDFIENELGLDIDSENPIIVSRVRPALTDNALLQFQRWRTSMIANGKPRTWFKLKEELWNLYQPKFQQRDMLYEFIDATVPPSGDIEEHFTRLELLYNRMSTQTQARLPAFMILSKFPREIRAYVDERLKDGDGLDRIRELANTAARYHIKKPQKQQNQKPQAQGKTPTVKPAATVDPQVVCFDCGGKHKRTVCKATAEEKEKFLNTAEGKDVAQKYERYKTRRSQESA